MLSNLNAEMARYGIKRNEVAKTLGCTLKTLNNKINGRTPMHISEAFAIKSSFFPDEDTDYLFATEGKNNNAS